jgi:hypothetical protein
MYGGGASVPASLLDMTLGKSRDLIISRFTSLQLFLRIRFKNLEKIIPDWNLQFLGGNFTSFLSS